MTLTTEEKTELIYLLSALQEHLEGAIESVIPRPIPDDEPERVDRGRCVLSVKRNLLLEVLLNAEIKDDYAPDIERDREDWRKTENWLLRLEAEA